jgi:predicted RNA-binding protein with PUA-like domain
MQKGDFAFFYHSNEGLEIVGIAEVVKTSYQDPTTEETAWVAVDFKPKKKLNIPVSLSQIKKISTLENMQLVKLQRLSVSAVTEKEFQIILDLSSTKL